MRKFAEPTTQLEQAQICAGDENGDALIRHDSLSVIVRPDGVADGAPWGYLIRHDPFMIRAVGVPLLFASAAAYELTGLQHVALRLSGSVSAAYAAADSVILRGVSVNPPPPLEFYEATSADEEAGLEAERRLSAAIACTLLGASAVRDPVGDWSRGVDTAYDHYSMAHLLDLESAMADMVLVVLPREPMSLTFGRSARAIALAPTASLVTERVRCPLAFCSAGCSDLFEAEESVSGPPQIDLDAGDALVLGGEHSAFCLPPDGLGAGALIYRYAACGVADALFCSPMHEARVHLQRSLVQRSYELAPAVSSRDE